MNAIHHSLLGLALVSLTFAQTTVAEWQKEVIRRYPELGEADSLHLRFFRYELTRHKAANKGYFDDPKWPVNLAQQSLAKCEEEASEADWQKEAIRQFSDLGRSETALFASFRAELTRLKTQEPTFFMTRKWPLILVQRCAAKPETASILIAGNPPASRVMVMSMDPNTGRIRNLGMLFGQTLTITEADRIDGFYAQTAPLNVWQEKPKPNVVYVWKGNRFLPVHQGD